MIMSLTIALIAAVAALLLLGGLLASVLLSPPPPSDGRPMPWQNLRLGVPMRITWRSEAYNNAMVCTVGGPALEIFISLPEPDPGGEPLPVGAVIHKAGTEDKPRLMVTIASGRVCA